VLGAKIRALLKLQVIYYVYNSNISINAIDFVWAGLCFQLDNSRWIAGKTSGWWHTACGDAIA